MNARDHCHQLNFQFLNLLFLILRCMSAFFLGAHEKKL